MLDTRILNKKNLYPIKLQIIFQRVKRLYATNLSCGKEDFVKINSANPRSQYKQTKLLLNEIEKKAIDAINSLSPFFSFEDFKDLMFPKQKEKIKHKDLEGYFNAYIKELKEQSKIKTAINYECSLHSLQNFKKAIDFKDLTPTFLKSYEIAQTTKGNTTTTVSFYLRCLRTIYNVAIKDGVCTQENYPFGKGRYTVPKGNNIKKALTKEELKLIFDYVPANDSEQFAKDMFLFSYCCNGMNMKDIALLKYKDIDKDKVTFIRAKTANSAKTTNPIVVIMNSKAKEILKTYSKKDSTSNTYVFPIFEPHHTPELRKNKLSQTIKNINKWVKVIAKKVGIEKNVTTYFARHTFATILKHSNISTEKISESLGHTSLATTERYLASFEDKDKKEISDLLIAF